MTRRTAVYSLLAIFACACSDPRELSEAKPSPAPVAVTVAPANLESVQRYAEVVGTLYGDEETTISAKVPGRIVEVRRDVGDRVAPGAALAQIDPTDYELVRNQQEMAVRESLAKLALEALPGADFDLSAVPTVKRARLQLENAQAKLDRAKLVFGQSNGAISAQEFADLQTAFEVAKSSYDVERLNGQATLAEARSKQAELEIARQRLSDTAIRSPAVKGATTAPLHSTRYAVAARLVSVGEYVREGTPLYRLIADDPIKYRASAPEKFLTAIKVGQRVRIRPDAYATPFEGVVARIAPQVDPSSRMFQVEALFANPRGELQAGSFARGQVMTQVQANVTYVPEQAVVSFAGVDKVYTVDGGKAVEHTVQLGERRDGLVEVTKGLTGKAEVVIAGANKLAGGVPVTVQPKSEAPVSKSD